MARTGERRLGKWMVGRRIGKGGQARVFEATSGEASDVLAIKPIFTRASKKGARFKQEVEQHAKLSARRVPNVIPVVDWHIDVREDGATEGYIVMPRAHASLDDVAATFEGRLELSLDVFVGIVRGVEAAHSEGVIHRDIKPANVLFLEPSLREPMVADFGICLVKDARVEDRLTDVGETVGARFYMAPEQERGGMVDVTEAADVYALGKLLHFMLTGRNLYREELTDAFTDDELRSDNRLCAVRDEVLPYTVVADPTHRLQTAASLRKLVEELITRFRGGPPRGEPGTPESTQISNQGSDLVLHAPEANQNSELSTPHSYETAVRDILKGNPLSVAVRFDRAKQRFDRTWSALRKELEPPQEVLIEGATALIKDQQEISFALLAIARFDTVVLFPEIPSYLEYLLNSTEGVAGDRRVRSVAHIAAGFQFMTAAVASVARGAWQLLSFLLNLKLEWYYQSARPLYSYALDHSYFFHPEALERKATAAHNLYQSLLSGSGFAPCLGLRDADLTTPYVQAQFLMSIKAAQLNEQGDTDVDPFAYFGRFYGDRLVPLLYRMEHDALYAKGIAAAFGEDPAAWFAKLSQRLVFVRRNFFDPGRYDWASLDGWPE